MKWAKNYSTWLTGLSFVGLVMMFWSTAQKIHFLNDPGQSLSCNLNPIMDCGTVINHELSSVFGVSNSLIGLAFFSGLFALGLAMMSGIKTTRNFRLLVVTLVAVMFGFATWFFAMSLYVIGKICLFCLGVWISVIPLTALTLKEMDADIWGKKSKRLSKVRAYIRNHPERIVVVLYALAVVLYLYRFREYYFG